MRPISGVSDCAAPSRMGDAVAPLLIASPGSGPPGSPNLSPRFSVRASQPRITGVIQMPVLEQVLLSVEGHVATVTLNRPEQRNPLSGAMLRDLASAFSWCRQEPVVRVVVLTGAGDRAFCAGADLSSFDGGMSDLERHRSRDLFGELFTLMDGLGSPIVGRINGH